ncbi:MAG: sialidase family protein [Opitutaceae bacterium]
MPTPADVIAHQTVYYDPEYYSAWPALVRCANGDLLLAFCRTEQHLYPSGDIVTVRSTDNGHTWSEPVVAYRTLIDDRECGLTVLPDGRIVMHIWSTHWKNLNYTSLAPGSYPQATLDRWMAQIAQPEYVAAAHLHGGWAITSADHGHTWSAAVPGPDSVHGGIALANGTLLVAAYRKDQGHISIVTAAQPEGPWTTIAKVENPESATHRFGEPHVVQMTSGRILLMIRFTARAYDDQRDDLHLWQSWSDDNGATWAPPQRTPLLGFPPHLTTLQDGRVLCTYGYRRKPFGEHAAISRDGITWHPDDIFVLRDDNASHDLGYPASLEVAPGEILSVYYQKPAFDPTDFHRYKTAIVSTRWRVPAG